VLGLIDVCFEKDRPCAACQVGKRVGTSHPSKNGRRHQIKPDFIPHFHVLDKENKARDDASYIFFVALN
jgi:hypothetical protein